MLFCLQSATVPALQLFGKSWVRRGYGRLSLRSSTFLKRRVPTRVTDHKSKLAVHGGDNWRQPNPTGIFHILTVLSGLNQYLFDALQLQISCLSCKDLAFLCFQVEKVWRWRCRAHGHPLGLHVFFVEIRKRPSFGSKYRGRKSQVLKAKDLETSRFNTLNVYWEGQMTALIQLQSGLDSIFCSQDVFCKKIHLSFGYYQLGHLWEVSFFLG